jgi:hypothetical protein
MWLDDLGFAALLVFGVALIGAATAWAVDRMGR